MRTSSPGPPSTLKAEQEKLAQVQNRQDHQQRDSTRNGVVEEPWDLLKQMEGIKIVRGRPQVQETPPPSARLEFKYPTVIQQQMYSHL